jgi:homogentisate phytyltransferase/homogentisate geranylgeranyltransferase
MLDTDLPHDRNENEAVPEQRGILSTVLAPFLTLFGPLAWAVGALWRGISKMAKRKADHLLREDVALGTSPLPKTQSFFATLWDFSRPHTLIGSALCIPALHYFAAPTLQAAVAPTVLWSCLTACLPAFLINIYITGLNQITDVAIDKVNKPYLPIASGALSVRAAIVTVCVCLVLGLGLVPLVYANVPFLQPFATEALQATLLGSAFLGTIYSLSPFRLKRFPLLAATCIFSVRGLLINVGFYAHALVSSFGGLGGTLLSLPLRDVRCGMAALFFVVFGVIIALMKDVPDLKGDKVSGIRTFTVRMGPTAIFAATSNLLACLFGGMAMFMSAAGGQSIVAGLYYTALARGIVGVTMLFVAQQVLSKAKDVDAENSKMVYQYYMFLWKIFYASYLALPFIR